MKQALEQIAEELDRRYRDGEEDVFIADETLERMRSLQNKADLGRKAKKVDKPPADEPRPSAQSQSIQTSAEMLDLPAPAKKVAPSKPMSAHPVQSFPPPPVLEVPSGTAAERLAWLRQQLNACEESRRHVAPGNHLVFGTGNPAADLFFVGEAPDAEEALRGEPFVGEAGELLNKMIAAMGLAREQVYLANLLTWRPENDQPTGNRPPTLEEIKFCLPYLQAQIEVVAPKVLVALGNTAVKGLLGPDPKRRITAIRGKWHSFAGRPLMVTFHPTYLLHNSKARTKRLAWEDMLAVMERLELPISAKQQGYFLPKG